MLPRPTEEIGTVREWIGPCSLAALGGMLPTLSRLAATYVTAPGTPLPELGLYFGLALFAVIGAILCRGFEQKEMKQALIVGIAAPGIITNVIAGASTAGNNDMAWLLFDRAFAQATGAVNPQATPDIPEYYASPPPEDKPTKMVEFNVDTSNFQHFQTSTPQIAAYGEGPQGKFSLGYLPQPGNLAIEVPYDTDAIILQWGDKEDRFTLISDRADIDVQLYVKKSFFNEFLWGLGADRKPGSVELRSTCPNCVSD